MLQSETGDDDADVKERIYQVLIHAARVRVRHKCTVLHYVAPLVPVWQTFDARTRSLS